MTKIDVLALLDSDHHEHDEQRPSFVLIRVTELEQARVAVAELIEAVIHLRSCSGDEGSDDGSVADLRLDAAKRRVDEALENCGVKA